MARAREDIQADIDVCQHQIDWYENEIYQVEQHKEDNLRRADREEGGMAQGYALVAAKMYNETLDKKIYYFQDELRPFKAQMEELRLEARDPEGYVGRERREAEAKRKAEKESNDRRYRELINELSEIAAKPVNDDISSSDYRSRIDALNRIKRGLNALPDDYDTAAYFEQCGSLHGVFEKSYNDRKYKELPNELSEIAAKPVNDDISSYEYRSRITALDQIKSGLTSLSGAYDTAAYIKKCDSLHGMFEKGLAAAQTREEKKEARRRAKMRRAKSAKSAGRVILGGLIGAASGGAAIFLLSVLVGGGDNVLVGVLLVIVGLISGGIVSHLIFDDSGCLTFFIGPIIGALIFGAVIFQGIPFIRYSIAASVSISSICAIGAAIGALIGSIVAGKT